MKKITIFLMIFAICGGAYGVESDSYKKKNTAPSDNTRVHNPYVPNLESPELYTIDKRKYVSVYEEPFSAVVGLKYSYSGAQNYCSGTLTTDGVVVTAKHCIYTDKGYDSLNNIFINYQYNTDVGVKKRVSSDADIYPNGGYAEIYDWAILVPKTDIKSTVEVSKMTDGGTSDVIVAGYGALKILSDHEIQNIRKEYAKWLNQNIGTKVLSDGIDFSKASSFGSQFIKEIKQGKISSIPAITFNDTFVPKASYCRATLSNNGQNLTGCQAWGGNSGGSVFYKYNNKWYLYGVFVSGYGGAFTNDRDTYAQARHMVPINSFFTQYQDLVKQLKDNTNEN